MYPISAEYVAEHGISEIDNQRLLKEVITQAVEAVSADIPTKDMVLCMNVVMAGHT